MTSHPSSTWAPGLRRVCATRSNASTRPSPAGHHRPLSARLSGSRFEDSLMPTTVRYIPGRKVVQRMAAVLLFVLPWTSVDAAPALIGKWKSDHELTMRFARDRAKMEDKTILFLDQMMGRLSLVFTPTQLLAEMPDWQSETAGGVRSQLVGFRESHRYKVLGSTADQVAIMSPEPVTGRQTITVYNFEGPDTMWVYVAGASFPPLNIREYFVRVK